MKIFKTKLSRRQRDFIADKLMDTANYALAGLVFASFLENHYVTLALFGTIVYIFGWIVSINMKE